MRRRSSVAPVEKSGSVTLTLGGEAKVIKYTHHDVHRISWDKPLTVPVEEGEPIMLPAGKCNLMFFPGITFDETRRRHGGMKDEHAEALSALFMLLADDRAYSKAKDTVGTLPILALAVANTEISVGLIVDLVEAKPERILASHGPGPFVGEGLMHVLAVNGRFDELWQLLRHSHEKLSASQMTELVQMQCTGGFFETEPQRDFGGHLFAWLACFGKIDLLSQAIDELGYDKWHEQPCTMTGFYPIHTAVRADNVKSTMFLIHRFGREQLGWRANGYTALVLAARSGRQSMVVHMLNERTLQKWVWGRLAQFTFELSGAADTDDIDDDPNSQGVSMLEVIIREDSPKEAQEMLLDSFMPVQGKGFIFHLIERKWDESRQWFNISAVLLLSYVVSLTILTVRVPSVTWFSLSASSARTLIYLILLFSFLLVMEEVRFVYLWWKSNKKPFMELSKAPAGLRLPGPRVELFVNLLRKQRYLPLRFTTLATAFVASVLLLSANGIEQMEARWRGEGVQCLLAIACSTAWVLVFVWLFVRWRALGKYAVMVERMLASDVLQYLVVLSPLLLAFSVGMNAVVPRSGTAGYQSGIAFNDMLKTLEVLFLFSTVGEPYEFPDDVSYGSHSDTDPYVAASDEYSVPWLVGLRSAIFVAFHFCFIIVGPVLMCNLLIASMASTYEKVEAGAELEWRLRFSRMVYHMELLEPRESQRNKLQDVPFEFVVDEKDSKSDPFHMIRKEAPPLKRGTSTAGVANQWAGGLSKRYSSATEKRHSSIAHIHRGLVSRVPTVPSLFRMPTMLARLSNEPSKDEVGP